MLCSRSRLVRRIAGTHHGAVDVRLRSLRCRGVATKSDDVKETSSAGESTLVRYVRHPQDWVPLNKLKTFSQGRTEKNGGKKRETHTQEGKQTGRRHEFQTVLTNNPNQIVGTVKWL